eukprot:scaffold1790_cov257-Pinguiococcus_pyrenoidosus.AAC.46
MLNGAFFAVDARVILGVGALGRFPYVRILNVPYLVRQQHSKENGGNLSTTSQNIFNFKYRAILL